MFKWFWTPFSLGATGLILISTKNLTELAFFPMKDGICCMRFSFALECKNAIILQLKLKSQNLQLF